MTEGPGVAVRGDAEVARRELLDSTGEVVGDVAVIAVVVLVGVIELVDVAMANGKEDAGEVAVVSTSEDAVVLVAAVDRLSSHSTSVEVTVTEVVVVVELAREVVKGWDIDSDSVSSSVHGSSSVFTSVDRACELEVIVTSEAEPKEGAAEGLTVVNSDVDEDRGAISSNG